MDLKTFEDKIISKIERNKNCNKVIKENQCLIKEYFVNCEDLLNIKNFVERLNNTILKAKKFDVAETFLKTPCMSKILVAFRESDVLLRACQNNYKKAARWLVTMKINPDIQDHKGMTALMYACTYYDLSEVVDALIKMNESQINVTDINGNTALFHAVKVKINFDKLVRYKIDTNHRNQNGDTIFTHICKKNKPKLIKSLITHHHDIDFTVVNYEERTGAMYLAENNNITELRGLHAAGVDLNLKYMSIRNESIVSHVVNRLYNRFKDSHFHEEYLDNILQNDFIDSKDFIAAKHFARTINALIDIGCDFNCVVDGDGNTPLMFFIMIKDYVSALNLLQYCKTMDLGICNKYGVSAAFLASRVTKDDFNSLKNIKDHLYVKINYDLFMKELNSYPTYCINTYNKSEKNLIDFCFITPYIKPEKVLSLQKALSEGYFARAGEGRMTGAFDSIFGPILKLNSSHPFV
ncbi:hypothetical protein PIROE2DRAFT_4606 [Piromyces sp. E2]|nr:hypothetical protein PIROE2DRAFT_4606 [Piromyces sp. E2]|eukprot:OUM67799.1 hypothetical protein PIROE2DRAFT_4606 [Piromyces sp. E2]